MTNSFNRRFDAMSHRAFKRAGIADTCTYTGPNTGDPAIPNVRITFDADVEMYGDQTQTVVHRDVVRIWREDVESTEGATVTIDGTDYTLASRIEQDEGKTTWVVQ